MGSGLLVSLLGWLACTVGSAFALAIHAAPQGAQAPVSRPVKPERAHAGPLALLVLAATGTAVAYAPAWDKYTLVASASGTSQTITAGNAFDNPGVMIAGNVAVMVAIVAMAALAALWRPPRQGALLLAGAIVPVAAAAISALIQVSQPASSTMFGISASQASALGLKISPGAHVLGVLCLRDFPARIVRVAVHRARSSGNAGIHGLRVAVCVSCDGGRARRHAKRRRNGPRARGHGKRGGRPQS
jgi:hypothetical protein